MYHILNRPIRSVAVVGAGTIGASWAAFFLAKGLSVVVTDPGSGTEAFCRDYISRVWSALTGENLSQERLSALPLRFEPELGKAMENIDFVQENAPEKLAFKQDLFAQLDACLESDVVIASSSSGLKMSDMQTLCRYPERCVIGHPFNPPHLIPLVEIVGGQGTSPEIVTAVTEFYRSLGKAPVVLHKEVTGHIANRLQAALWREAAFLVQEGVASAADVDLAVTEGPGLRWALYGPLMTFHLGGGQGGLQAFFEHLGEPLASWCQDLGDIQELSSELKELLLEQVQHAAQGQKIAALAQRRDQLLQGLIALKKD